MTDTDTLREALEHAYEKVRLFPENRGDPMTVGGEGFLDLLALRNLIPDVLATLSKPEPAAVGERPAVPAKNGFLSFWYKNYRGELSERVAIPIRIYHGATEWHPEPQWLLEAWDMEKDAVRAFAMSDMQAPPPSPEAISPPAIEQIIAVLEAEQKRLDEEDYLMDTRDCIATIREKFAVAPAISPPDAPPECKECGRQLPNDCRVCAAIEAASASPPDARAVVEGVTQEDREAAADFIDEDYGGGWDTSNMRAGKCDDHKLVQAFMRHRIAALQSGASK